MKLKRTLIARYISPIEVAADTGVVFAITFCILSGLLWTPAALGQGVSNANTPPSGGGDKMFVPRNIEKERRDNTFSMIAYEADALLKEGKLEEAQKKYESLPKTAGAGVHGYLRAREGLAEIYSRRGQWARCVREYERRFDSSASYASNNHEIEMRAKFALVLCKLNRFDEALVNYATIRTALSQTSAFESGLPLPPIADTFRTRPELIPIKVHLLLAAYQLVIGDKKKVESEAGLGSEAGSDNRLAHLYTGLALADFGSERAAEAKRELEKAISGTIDPKIEQAAAKTLARLNQK